MNDPRPRRRRWQARAPSLLSTSRPCLPSLSRDVRELLPVFRSREGARAFLLRRVVTDLELAGDGHRVELHVDGAVVVDEGDSDAVPVALAVPLADYVDDLHFAVV